MGAAGGKLDGGEGGAYLQEVRRDACSVSRRVEDVIGAVLHVANGRDSDTWCGRRCWRAAPGSDLSATPLDGRRRGALGFISEAP